MSVDVVVVCAAADRERARPVVDEILALGLSVFFFGPDDERDAAWLASRATVVFGSPT